MANKFKRNGILVLGMHRSGTSALTRVLNILGYALPKSLMGANKGNQVGHWESDAFVVLNDSLLEELGGRWDSWQYVTSDQFPLNRKKDILEDISRHIRLEFPGTKDFVLKDPRTSRLAKLYIEAFKDNKLNSKIVISIRNPLAVAQSLLKRDNISKGDAALLWLRYYLDAEHQSRGQSRAFCTYEQLMSDNVGALEQISRSLALAFPVPIKDAQAQINTFLDEKLQNYKHTSEEVVLDPVMRGWIDQAYSALLSLCTNPSSKKAMKDLENIREELDHVGPVMENLRKEAEAKYEEQAALLVGTKNINKVLGERITGFVTQKTKAKRESGKVEENRDKQITELKSQSEKLEQDRDKQARDLAAAKSKVGDLTKLTKQQKDELAAETKKYADLKSKSEKLKSQIEQFEGEASQLAKTLEQKGRELAEKLNTEKELKGQIDQSNAKIEALQKDGADKTKKINTLTVEFDKLWYKSVDLGLDLERLKTELAKEKRTLVRPAIRRTRQLVGRSLRLIFPSKLIDRMARKMPPNETELKFLSDTKHPPKPEDKTVDDAP